MNQQTLFDIIRAYTHVFSTACLKKNHQLL